MRAFARGWRGRQSHTVRVLGGLGDLPYARLAVDISQPEDAGALGVMSRLGGVNKIGAGCFFGSELDVARGIIGEPAGREMPANVLDVFGRFVTDRTRDEYLLGASVFGPPHANIVRGPFAEEGVERIGEEIGRASCRERV